MSILKNRMENIARWRVICLLLSFITGLPARSAGKLNSVTGAGGGVLAAIVVTTAVIKALRPKVESKDVSVYTHPIRLYVLP